MVQTIDYSSLHGLKKRGAKCQSERAGCMAGITIEPEERNVSSKCGIA
jgi:hypothetical protein